MSDETRTFTLSADDYNLLIFALGVALGAVWDNPPLFRCPSATAGEFLMSDQTLQHLRMLKGYGVQQTRRFVIAADDYALLKFALWTAAGVVKSKGDMPTFERIMRLANSIRAGEPTAEPEEEIKR